MHMPSLWLGIICSICLAILGNSMSLASPTSPPILTDIEGNIAKIGKRCRAAQAPLWGCLSESYLSFAGPSENACTPPPALTVPLTLGLAIDRVEVHVTDDTGNMPPLSACPELLLAKMQDLKVQPFFSHNIKTYRTGAFAS